jgi:hypothetical protein
MGSTTQSTNFTPSTQVAYNSGTGTLLYMAPVTSSGAYFNVGDCQEVMIFVANASSSDSATSGALWIEPGARWAGSRGLAPSTIATAYSTATAPIVLSLATHGITGSSAVGSTTGSFGVFGPFESAQVKSSDEKIYIIASTGSTKMFAAVYQMIGGSTQ